MPLRLLEIFARGEDADAVHRVADASSPVAQWEHVLADDLRQITVLLDATQVDMLSDELEARCGENRGFRMVLLPVEATIPRPPEPEKPEAPPLTAKKKPLHGSTGISREELHSDIADTIRSRRLFHVMAALSTLTAALGILADNTAAIIGAMVIAPLLGPNMAFALGTTLGDPALSRRALLRNISGLAIALVISIAIGAFLAVDPTGPELLARTTVGLGDVALALASGIAGALAFTSGLPATLVGVMVAVALVPPAATMGMLIGSTEWALAGKAGLLLAVNVICINVAAIGTFIAQGVHPSSWWDRNRAKRAAWVTLIAWVTLLTVAMVLILLFGTTR